jgi:hypothetical protein
MTQTNHLSTIPISRPTAIRENYIEAVAEALVPDVINWLGSRNGCEDTVKECLIEAMKRCGSWGGFEIAREMEKIGGYDPDIYLAEILHYAEAHFISAYDADLERWITRENIQPAYGVGDEVWVYHLKNQYEGKIIKIFPKHGRYCVCIPELGHVMPPMSGINGIIVDYEQVFDGFVYGNVTVSDSVKLVNHENIKIMTQLSETG